MVTEYPRFARGNFGEALGERESEKRSPDALG
jgi:hypothetical protein